MNDIVESARTARQKLAAALALLQMQEAGESLDTVAEPVARAMGALHGIESSAGASLAVGGPTALVAVREALAALQSAPSNSTLEKASEQVAGSLGLVHGLAQKALLPSVGEPVAQPASVAPPSVAPPSVAPNLAKTAPSVAPPALAQQAKSQAAVVASTSPARSAPPISPLAPAPAGAGAFDKTAAASRSPVAHVEQSRKNLDPLKQLAAEPPVQEAHQVVPTQASRPAQPPRLDSKHAPAPLDGPEEGALIIEANLGAHSATNFYKGLSGNDVVADGGLFVATYKIPPIGTTVWLKVTLPGGYDFEAGGKVRWSRESGAGDAPPGFGAALQSISKEAKQLIYRYVKNREPLFHDDF